MENQTFRYSMLLIEGLNISHQYSHFAFILFLIVYLFIVVLNVGILIEISIEKSLHQPMYVLFCNLTVNDLLGTTLALPHLMRNMFLDPSERYITFVECAMQAFFVNLHGTTSHTILMIMAFDRYVAICNPLRYSTIMTGKVVAQLSTAAWGVAFVLVSILIGLSLRLSHCRYKVESMICDNASLFKLSCESIVINNIYGLFFTAVLLTSSMASVALTYLTIAMVCYKSKNKATNNKAVKTCSTHLTVYLIMLVSGFLIIILHRFPDLSEYRKLSSIMFHVVPSCLNPMIYGLQAKEIRQRLFKIVCKSKVSSM